jgi:cytochrome P450
MVSAMPIAPAASVIGRLRDAGCRSEQIRGVGAALLLTGTDTLSSALPRAAALISDAQIWSSVTDGRTRPALIDECLRVITPSPAMLRSVQRDTTVGGHRFHRGRRVVVMTYWAVRGFPDGSSFRPDREIPAAVQGLQFGAGIHHCIGYALACAEMDTWLRRLAAIGPLRVSRRTVAHRVLIPRYRLLEVERVQ